MLNQDGLDFFWQRVNKLDDGCWEWTGSFNRGCSPNLYIHENGKYVKMSARKASWQIHKDPQEIGTIYSCKRNPKCVNPEHLSVAHSAADKIPPEKVEEWRRDLDRYLNWRPRSRRISMY